MPTNSKVKTTIISYFVLKCTKTLKEMDNYESHSKGNEARESPYKTRTQCTQKTHDK